MKELSEWYSFIKFPGPVERSFIPSIILAVLNYPIHYVLVDILKYTSLASLCSFRIILGMMVLCSLKYMKLTIIRVLNCETTAKWFSLLFLTQFTYLFDGSRPYYNTFAMILINIAYCFWMQKKWHLTISYLAVSSIIFRWDTTVFAFAIIVIDLIRWRIPLVKWFIWGTISTILSIALTVSIDSLIYGRLIWPEFQVFYYNTVLNMSHNWGVDPWHTYFVRVLPLNVTISYPLAIFAIFYKRKESLVDFKVLELISPAILFIFLYSFLPHKEYRFLFPSYSIFNLCAAISIKKILEDNLSSSRCNKKIIAVLVLWLYGGIFFVLSSTYAFFLI